MNEEYNKLMLYKPKEDIVKDYLILEHNWNELKKLMEEETRQYWSEDILIIMGQLEEGGNNDC